MALFYSFLCLYSVIKENEIVPFAATWKDLDIVILNEINQRKTNSTSLICGI